MAALTGDVAKKKIPSEMTMNNGISHRIGWMRKRPLEEDDFMGSNSGWL
jgi:hypothetical protein